MTDKPIDLEVVDPSGLTDADWAEINRLRAFMKLAVEMHCRRLWLSWESPTQSVPFVSCVLSFPRRLERRLVTRWQNKALRQRT